MSPRGVVPKNPLPPVKSQVSTQPLTKSFPCHTCRKSPAKSNHCHTSKMPLPQALCLPHIRAPRGLRVLWLTSHRPVRPARNSLRINTCRTVSRQTTLSTFKINTYEKLGGRVPRHFNISNFSAAPNPSSFQSLLTDQNRLCYTEPVLGKIAS